MKYFSHERLLDEVLAPPAMAGSLVATLKAVRQRRQLRSAAQVASVAATLVALTLAWTGFRQPRKIAATSGMQPVTALPAPPFILVTTTTSAASVVVRTRPGSSCVVFSTFAESPALASVEDVFALAGNRSLAVWRQADGTERWMWVNAGQR